MSQTYITTAGDTADSIAFKVYGKVTDDVLNAVLEANKGLADYGPVLPENIAVTLPDITEPTKQAGARLWD